MVEAHWDGVLNQIEGRFSTLRKFRLVHSPTKFYVGSQPYEIICWVTALRNSMLVHSPTKLSVGSQPYESLGWFTALRESRRL
jgi:hypothetical protein